jgi:hypothetical protein
MRLEPCREGEERLDRPPSRATTKEKSAKTVVIVVPRQGGASSCKCRHALTLRILLDPNCQTATSLHSRCGFFRASFNFVFDLLPQIEGAERRTAQLY